ncbi:MAG: hypothetical protein [Bacteriophage sp.]|nr:MAG: hypothetical protein [Bacteriophage sp.]
MDIASFVINLFNKVEPISEDSKSLLRVELSNQFSKSISVMEKYNKAEKHNFELDNQIENLPLDLPPAELEHKRNVLEQEKIIVKKPSLYDRGIAFLSTPVAKLVLYGLFILISGYIAKRMLKKDSVEEEAEQLEPSFHKRKLSKKEKKRILKQYQHENFK